ncbi:hypothetical protein Goarm_000330, partial [Gossypium armourianum]|nr:hypothetical protein [Gossypium armourianum]
MLGRGGSVAFGRLGSLEGSGGSTPGLGNDGMDGFGNDGMDGFGNDGMDGLGNDGLGKDGN